MDTKFNKDWRKSDKWQNILGIPLSDCINCTGQMERAVLFPKKIEKNMLAFGKYKGKTKEWVKENDPGYYQWASENVRGF